MKVYFVEDYDSNISFEKSSKIIALTPKACYELDKIGIDYSIIEDYYKEKLLLANELNYFKSQQDCINDMDDYLQKQFSEYKEFDLRMVNSYFLFFKTLIDPVFVRTYQLTWLIDALKPSKIVYVSKPNKEIPIDFHLYHEGKSLYAHITPKICEKKKIDFETHILEQSTSIEESTQVEPNQNGIKKFRKLIGKLIMSEKWDFFFKHGMKCIGAQRKSKKLKILLLKEGYNSEKIIEDSLRGGHDFFLLSGEEIKKIGLFGPKKYKRIEYEDQVGLKTKLKNDKDSIEDQIKNLLLVTWTNEICKVDVSDLIIPRLKYFIFEICPEIFRYFKYFMKFYDDEKIDYVMIPFQWFPIEFAAVSAAQNNKHTKTVGIQHGNEIFLNRFWYNQEMREFDVYISTDYEIRDHFRKIVEENNYKTKVYSSWHRLRPIKKIKGIREELQIGSGPEKAKKEIIYLPTVFMWDYRRLDGAEYPDTWYYKFQKSLIDHFAEKNDFTFIWKGLPVADHVYNPIPDYISDKNYNNIEIATDKFPQYLPTAEKVIIDFPCTGFYESIISGVPVISIYHDAILARKSAEESLGKLIRTFSDIPEAKGYIDEFLESDPDSFTGNLQIDDKNVVDILESLNASE